MATTTLTTPKVWFDGVDLDPRLFATTQEYTCDVVDDTVFSDSVRSAAAGLLAHRFVDQGYFSAGGGNDIDDILYANVGTQNIVRTVAPLTGAAGEAAYTTQLLLARYNPFDGGTVGEMHAVTLEGQNDGTPLVRGTVLENASKTGTGASSPGYQVGAIGATEIGYGALHVIDSVSLTSIDVDIESDDNSSFTSATSRMTFTQQTADGSDWQTVSGAVTDDWWRINVTGFVGTSAVVVVVFGIL